MRCPRAFEWTNIAAWQFANFDESVSAFYTVNDLRGDVGGCALILCWLNRRRDSRKPVLLRWDLELLSAGAFFCWQWPSAVSAREVLSELTRRNERGCGGTSARLFRSYCVKPAQPLVFGCILIVCLLTWPLVPLRLGCLMKRVGVLIVIFNDEKVWPWWSSFYPWHPHISAKRFSLRLVDCLAFLRTVIMNVSYGLFSGEMADATLKCAWGWYSKFCFKKHLSLSLSGSFFPHHPWV